MPGRQVPQTLAALRESLATKRAKAKFILATDGVDFEAEDLNRGETVACTYTDFPDHFGFFLPLAGISTVKQIRESAFDIKATGRLNRLKDNPEWGSENRRHEMNLHGAPDLLFFAEDTDIFGSMIQAVADEEERSVLGMHYTFVPNILNVLNLLFRARWAS